MSARRINTKIGDIFEARLKNGDRRYFQYVANDLTQLNSSVIRAFKARFDANAQVDLEILLSGDVDFNVHTMLKPGIQLGYWEKVGSSNNIGDPSKILFRFTNEFGEVPGKLASISHKWYVWRIGEEFRDVGRLHGENRLSEIGSVMPPIAVMNRLETGDYQYFTPGFE